MRGGLLPAHSSPMPRRLCKWAILGHPGTAATVGAVWLFFINPTAALVLFMGYRFLMNQ